MKIQAAGTNELHGCFYYCSGKYIYFANLVDDIRRDMVNQNSYISYLGYFINAE